MPDTKVLTNRPTAAERAAHRAATADKLRDERAKVRTAVDPATVGAALASLTAHDRDDLARIARSEARRWAVLSIDPDDLATDALLRWIDPAHGGSVSMAGMLRTPARSTALARYRMTARSIATGEAQRAGVYSRHDTAAARAAAIEADGPELERIDRDRDAAAAWRWATTDTADDGARRDLARSIKRERVAERGNLLPHDVGRDGGPVRLLRVQSLEAMLTDTLRVQSMSRIGSSPDGETAGRTAHGIGRDDLEGRREVTDRLALTADDLRYRAAVDTAYSATWTAIAELLGQSADARRATAVEAHRAMLQADDHRDAAHTVDLSTVTDPDAVKRVRMLRRATIDEANRAASVRCIAHALTGPVPTLLDLLTGATSATDDGTRQRRERRAASRSIMDWTGLARLIHGRSDDVTVASLRAAVRSLFVGPYVIRTGPVSSQRDALRDAAGLAQPVRPVTGPTRVRSTGPVLRPSVPVHRPGLSIDGAVPVTAPGQ